MFGQVSLHCGTIINVYMLIVMVKGSLYLEGINLVVLFTYATSVAKNYFIRFVRVVFLALNTYNVGSSLINCKYERERGGRGGGSS